MRFPAPAVALFVFASLAVSTEWPATSTAQVTRNMQVLSHFDDYHVPVVGQPWAYSACWSYIHPDGREYAVLGTSGGAAIYNVTNPSAAYRVAFIPGPPSIWREIKQYRYWIYIVTEGHGPGQGLQIRSVNMDFRYGSSFAVDSPDAYETLLLDAMIGDPSLFTRGDEVERAWEILDPILRAWPDGKGGPLHFYGAGTWGPPAANELLERDQRAWRRL